MSLLAPILARNVDDIDLIFHDSLYNVTYSLYGKKIHSVMLQGVITRSDAVHELIEFDDGSNRILEIKYNRGLILPQICDERILSPGTRVSITCGLSHIICGDEALLCLRKFCPLIVIIGNLRTLFDDDVIKRYFRIFSDDLTISLGVAVTFKDRLAATNGLDWDSNGEVMVSCSFDRSVYIYCVNKASVTNVLQSKKHGVSCVKFTHDGPRQIVCSSSPDAPTSTMRLWDIVENRYIRSYQLSSPLVHGVGIDTHRSRGLILTSATNGSVSLYTFDSTTPLHVYECNNSIASFDYDGLIFGRYESNSKGNKSLALHDISKHEVPFGRFELNRILKATEDVVNITFNPNGRFIILGTNFRRLICLDSMSGSPIFACCYGQIPAYKVNPDEYCYHSISPDGKYLACGLFETINVYTQGCYDGGIGIWNTKGQQVATFPGHEGPPAFVAFNPKKALLASACESVLPFLFRNRACLRALFRSLTELEQLLILRLLNVKQAVSERALRLWMNSSAIGELRRALGNLEANCILQFAETKTKDGKNQYELNQDFKRGLFAALYGVGDVSFDSELELCYNIVTAQKNSNMQKVPTVEELIKHSKDKLDFLLLFLVSKQVRKKTISASKLARRIHKQKAKQGNESKTRAMQERLSKLTKYAGTISLDLLKVLERYDMVSDAKGVESLGQAQGAEMSRQALSWLLKGVYSQITILLVGYLANLKQGKGGIAATKWDEASSLEKSQITTRSLIETVQLLLCLSQARFGDCFSLKSLTKAQIRLCKFLFELGLVYYKTIKGPMYACDLSYIIPGQAQYYCGNVLYARSNVHDKKDGGRIIVQSNFKVYVYTASELQISVLSHICELQARTPNLVVGVLTRDSVQGAFKSGITSDQIIRFFASKHHQVGGLNFTNTDGMGIPENVVRQIHMWEAERNRIELKAAVLFKRWDSEFMPELFQRMVRWAQGKRYELYHTAWPLDPTTPEYDEWLRREKYLACPLESKEEVVDKIRQLRAQIVHERANGNNSRG
ncbi:bifunctional Transcription factor Tfb2 [Babesia duncani]|uniref:General transcription factor IIH subunit 4 n=1 Tax=Babesia duncani TaxID=323732 RepID=A0AAD9PLE8_9APIC|nr:bifunctional Transcription factor Tfb2 [Babesia duncani]